MEKNKYEIPKLVSLEIQQGTQANCTSGSGNLTCMAGPSATSLCGTGVGATNDCQVTGSLAEGQCNNIGLSPT